MKSDDVQGAVELVNAYAVATEALTLEAAITALASAATTNLETTPSEAITGLPELTRVLLIFCHS